LYHVGCIHNYITMHGFMNVKKMFVLNFISCTLYRLWRWVKIKNEIFC